MTVTHHRKKHSICSKCMLLSLGHAIKQSRHWSLAWSMKLCWLLTTFQSDASSAHGRTSLVSDKHVLAFRFQSVSLGAGALVWFSCSQGWKWLVHRTITAMSCCSNSCCNTSVKLLMVTYFPVHHASIRALSCCDTRLRTSHQICGLPTNRRQSCRLRDMDSHSVMHLSETQAVIHHW